MAGGSAGQPVLTLAEASEPRVTCPHPVGDSECSFSVDSGSMLCVRRPVGRTAFPGCPIPRLAVACRCPASGRSRRQVSGDTRGPIHDLSTSRLRPRRRFACFAGTFGASARQIGSTRLSWTIPPERRGRAAIVDSFGRMVAQGAEVQMTAHFFTAPTVNPLTNDLWSTRNTTTMGNTMTSDAAVSCPHSTPSSVKNW